MGGDGALDLVRNVIVWFCVSFVSRNFCIFCVSDQILVLLIRR